MISVMGQGIKYHKLTQIEPTAPPGAGSRWRPIAHVDLVDALQNEVYGQGWEIAQELYTTTKNGADMAGAFVLSGIDGVSIPGVSMCMGFINSNSRTKALRVTVGAEVACCTNGMCTGSIVMSRLHDHTVKLEEEVGNAVNRYRREVARVPGTVARLRRAVVSNAQASEVLMETARRRLVGWAAIGRVDAEYRNPSFEEHGTGTSWALLNAFTYAARRNIRPERQMGVYAEFMSLLPGATGQKK